MADIEAKRLAAELRGYGTSAYTRAADLIDRQAAALAEIAALHRRRNPRRGSGAVCGTCGVAFPCATAAAIAKAREASA